MKCRSHFLHLLFLIVLASELDAKHFYIEFRNKSTLVEFGEFSSDFFDKQVRFTKNCSDISAFDITQLTGISSDSVKEVLVYIHCWLGNERNFHRASLKELLQMSYSDTAQTQTSISIIWQPVLAGYGKNWKKALGAGQAHNQLFKALCLAYPDKINLVMHSMGHRVLQGFLSDNTHLGRTKFKEVILAAADVEAGVFEEEFKTLARISERIHVLIHRKDRLLRAAAVLKGKKRLGRVGPKIKTPPANVYVYDLTQTRTIRRPDISNHLYFVWNPYVKKMLTLLLQHRSEPQQFNVVVKE